jgi:N-acetylneuraminic acid mutarotase
VWRNDKNAGGYGEKIVNLERNMVTKRTMEVEMASVGRKIAKVETKMAIMETNMKRGMADIKADMEGKLEAVNNEVTGLKTALIEGFDEMKDVLVKVEDKIEENPRKRRRTASGDIENTASGDSQRTWSPLQSLPEERCGATSFVYNNHVTIAGGYCSGCVNDMIRMNINPNPDLSTHWSECPVKLPAKLALHSSVLYNDHLIVTGGFDGTADCIHEVQLVPPYTAKLLTRMPEPRMYHCMEISDDNLLIVGGRKTGRCQDSLSSVLLYDIKKNEFKQLAPLPYEVSKMATVRWGDNIVIVGGSDKHDKALDTVIMYNVKTGQSNLLPSMRCGRYGCTAVVIGNNIVVLGGEDEQGELKSVETFNFESYAWQELPEMSQARSFHTAVVV